MTQTKRSPLAAVADVLTERRRQIEVEDWTPQHDDHHAEGEMARAAAAYAMSAAGLMKNAPTNYPWPWADGWWKPKDKRSDLVRAAALLIAEIERLDRGATWREETAEEQDEDGRR